MIEQVLLNTYSDTINKLEILSESQIYANGSFSTPEWE